jgi:hypothetical protein
MILGCCDFNQERVRAEQAMKRHLTTYQSAHSFLFVLLVLLLPVSGYGGPQQTWSAACADHILKLEYPQDAVGSRLTGEVIFAFDVDSSGRTVSLNTHGPSILAKTVGDAVGRTLFPEACRGKHIAGSFWFRIEGEPSARAITTLCFSQPNQISVISSAEKIGCAVWEHVGALTAEGGLNPVTVCEVLANPIAYNGKNIALLGRSGETFEGWWLTEDNCSRKLESDGYTWDNIVWVDCCNEPAPDPPSGLLVLDPEALAQKLAQVRKTTKLKLERRWVFRVDAEGKSQAEPRDIRQKWAIVYGRVEARKKLRPPRATGPNRDWGNGFGHLGGAPVQIVMKQENSVYIPDQEPNE